MAELIRDMETTKEASEDALTAWWVENTGRPNSRGAWKARALAAEDRATAAEAAIARLRDEVVEETAKAAAGKSAEFDFASAMAECRDGEHGFHSGRLHAAQAIRDLKDTHHETR